MRRSRRGVSVRRECESRRASRRIRWSIQTCLGPFWYRDQRLCQADSHQSLAAKATARYRLARLTPPSRGISGAAMLRLPKDRISADPLN
jgi:hypothetical protein